MNSFDSYQNRVTKVKKYQSDPELFLLGKLTEESGEVAKEIVRRKEGRGMEKDLTSELGDVLWAVTAIAEHHDIKLSEIVEVNLNKLESRNLL